MAYPEPFLFLFGLLAAGGGGWSLCTGRFRSVEYDDMTGAPALFWSLIWIVAGLTLCVGVAFRIEAIITPFRWFLQQH